MKIEDYLNMDDEQEWVVANWERQAAVMIAAL